MQQVLLMVWWRGDKAREPNLEGGLRKALKGRFKDKELDTR